MAGQPSAFHAFSGSRVASAISGTPSTANTSWLRNTVKTEPLSCSEVTADAENTITRPMTSSSSVAPSSR